MSILGNLFGTEKALTEVVGVARGLLDEAFYTDQEEAADRAVARERGQEMIIRWVEASKGSNLARRYIALAVTFMWLAMYGLAAVMDLAGVWYTSRAAQLTSSADLIGGRADALTSAVMLILGYYFAAPFMGDIAKRFGGEK